MKKELKSYSEAVKKLDVESFTLKKIKTAVKDIVKDRRSNLMIFGLEDAYKFVRNKYLNFELR